MVASWTARAIVFAEVGLMKALALCLWMSARKGPTLLHRISCDKETWLTPDRENVCWLAQWVATVCVSFVWLPCHWCCFSQSATDSSWQNTHPRMFCSCLPAAQTASVYERVRCTDVCGRGLAPVSGGWTWASFKDEAPLQLSAVFCEKAHEAAANGHDIGLSCQKKMFWMLKQRFLRGDDDYLECSSAGKMTIDEIRDLLIHYVFPLSELLMIYTCQ